MKRTLKPKRLYLATLILCIAALFQIDHRQTARADSTAFTPVALPTAAEMNDAGRWLAAKFDAQVVMADGKAVRLTDIDGG